MWRGARSREKACQLRCRLLISLRSTKQKARVSLPRKPPGLEASGMSGLDAASFSATLAEWKIALISSGSQIVSLFLKSRARTHLHSGR